MSPIDTVPETVPSFTPSFRSLPIALLGVLLGLLPLSPCGASEAAGSSDAEALQVADRLMEALGGGDAWEATRYLKFRFFGRRDHVWDRYTGRHRVEGDTPEGEHFVVLHDIHDRGEGDGQVFLDGEPLAGDEKSQWLQRAYAAWVNDTYWLVMPYKLRDPGVHLAYEGTEEIDGQSYDVVRLSFDEVGMTPGDRYWAYVNRETGRMDRWAYHLQSMKPEDPPTAWDWQGWKRYGDIWLAPTRKQVGEDRELSLAPIEVPESVPDSVFETP